MDRIQPLIKKTEEFFEKDTRRIEHFKKVHHYAELIGQAENLDEVTMTRLLAAAIVHDTGIKSAEALYGYNNAQLQEEFGPKAARPLLLSCRYRGEDILRICYLVAHHHSYDAIDGIDFQILVEADFLVNFEEEQMTPHQISEVCHRIFKTTKGKALCKELYHIE